MIKKIGYISAFMLTVVLSFSCKKKNKSNSESDASGSAQVTSGSNEQTQDPLYLYPAINSFQINGGDSQRSVVSSMEISFDRVLDTAILNDKTISIINETTDETIIFRFTSSEQNGSTLLNFTFLPGPSVNNDGELEDGVYRLDVDVDGFKEIVGYALSDTEIIGLPQGEKFHRLLGDFDGDGAVNFDDYSEFEKSYGKPEGHFEYYALADFNEDGLVDDTDLALIHANVGKRVLNQRMALVGDIDNDGVVSEQEQELFGLAISSDPAGLEYLEHFDSDGNGIIDDLDSVVFGRASETGIVNPDHRAMFTLGADIDGDGDVDSRDLAIYRRSYRTSVGDALYDEKKDFNSDGTIDEVDFSHFQKLYYFSYETIAVSNVFGDFNADETLWDAGDIAIYEAAYGSQEGDGNYVEAIDANRDGIIDIADHQILQRSINDPSYLPPGS